MCGMLIFYILTGGKHPFGSSERECQENIKQGQPMMDSYLEDIEGKDLVRETTKGNASTRPIIDVVVKHPYFWDINKRFQFLLQVGRKITFYTSRPTRIAEEFKESCIEARDWIFYVPLTVINFVTKCTNTYYKNEFSHLLLFAVGLQENFELMPKSLTSIVLIPSHFVLLTFPTIFMSIFHVIRRNSVLQKQMGLEAFF
ncbi:unnamed protein product [Larinioides sclopetarius]|uniref:Uncharacterized protein n=1 Tax=Larinioides sclopetarius TaxID=280406 RepID=A0AAV2BXQ7_9ARAC